MKILIIGAGPTGLTAGIELARRGINAEIIERRADGSVLSRAIGISPQSLKTLTPSGATEKLEAAGITYNSMRIYRGSKMWAKVRMTAAPIQHGRNTMLGLPQNQTEEILREVFESLGGKITFGIEFTGLTQSDTGVIAQTSKGEIACDYLIGADGSQSVVRSEIGVELDATPLPDVWSIADVDVSNWPHTQSVTMCLMPKGLMAAVLPIGLSRYRFVSNTDDALRDLPFDLDVTKLHRKGIFHITLSHVKAYSVGRVYLAGDASHSQSPAGGRGMNLGIADAAALAARFENGDLAGYSKERLVEGARVMAGAEFMRKMVTSKNPLRRGALLTVFWLAAHIPLIERRLVSNVLYG